METMSLGGFDAWHLFGAVLMAGICAIIIYSMWDCCDKTECPTQREENVLVKQLFALELEPGLVVLQSQDGAYFRILQECDSSKYRNDQTGTSRSGENSLTGQAVTYIPPCVRTEVRNTATAPPPSNENLLSWNTFPPPYEG